jgi:phosphatidylglycerol---prolipoprotein diacylglyceryl transferase
MRPEIIPHLLEFHVQTWWVIFILASLGLGAYNGWLTYTRDGRDDKARAAGLTQAGIWAGGGILLTVKGIMPLLVIPDAAKNHDLYSLPLHTYGFAIALGFMLAIQLSAREAARSGIFPGHTPPLTQEERERAKNTVLDLAFWVLLAAIVGSRLYFIAVNWDGPEGYGAHPENILKFWTGGLVFYGGFIGAVTASILYSRRHKIDFLKLADLSIPTVSLGQFFGRLGCFAAGCCYGKEAKAPWEFIAVHFPQGSLAWDSLVNQRHTLAATELHTPGLYPSQLVDGFGQLIIFLVLTFLVKPNKRYTGQILLTWLFLYPLLRFSDEFLRGDIERGLYTSLQVSAGQLTSLALMLVSLGLLIYTHRRKTSGESELPPGSPPAVPA